MKNIHEYFCTIIPVWVAYNKGQITALERDKRLAYYRPMVKHLQPSHSSEAL